MTDTQILLTACIATVAYAAAFVVVFDKVLAWSERKATAGTTVAETETAAAEAPLERTARRPLRGLAAEPTVLPRAVSRMLRPVVEQDDAIPALMASLDKVPSRIVATA